jgi:hypothetical protein
MRRALIAASVVAVLVLIVWLARRREEPSIGTTPINASSSGVASAPTNMIVASSSAVTNTPVVVAKAAPSITVPWGSGSGALGRKAPQEGNAEAPMSFAVDANGVTWVLDQVNDRIVRYGKDGKVLDTIPLTVKGAQDIVIAKDGSALVLDRLVDKRVAILGPDGKARGSLTLEGKGLPEGGGATGVFSDGSSVWVEREHERSVRLGDTKGTADADRKEMPGRPTRDGTGFIRAWLEPVPGQRAFVTFTNKDTEAQRFTRQLTTSLVSMGIVLLDTDAAGIIYLGVIGGALSPEGEPVGDAMITLYCLEPLHGAPIGQTTIAANKSADETFREIAVLDGGGALFMKRTDTGVTMVPIDCRGQ